MTEAFQFDEVRAEFGSQPIGVGLLSHAAEYAKATVEQQFRGRRCNRNGVKRNR
jgi:hypothetical protein